MFNADEVKNLLTIDDIYSLLSDFDAEPSMVSHDKIVALTICHDGDSRKLYYYNNTQLFNCYTHCDSFDVFELLIKLDQASDLDDAVNWVVSYFNLYGQLELPEQQVDEMKILNNLYNNEAIVIKDNLGYKQEPYTDVDFLNHLPKPRIIDWPQISKEVCDFAGICYDPIYGHIVIPHYDIDNNLIGIRRRTLIKEEEKWGKYMPMKHHGISYPHKLGFNLYGINWSKEAIERGKIAFVYESEKSVLQHMTYQGTINSPAVALCGQNLSQYQFDLLRSLGVKEICLCLDKDYQEYKDDDYWKVLNHNIKICRKNAYNQYCNMSFIFDEYGNKLKYKEAPIEEGWNVFYDLFKNRYIVN